jgi:hypothetical protein
MVKITIHFLPTHKHISLSLSQNFSIKNPKNPENHMNTMNVHPPSNPNRISWTQININSSQIRVSFITNRSNPTTNSQDHFEFQRFSDSIGNHHHRIFVSFLQFEPQGDHKKEFEREEKKTDRIRNWTREEEDRRNQHRITGKSETLGFQIKNRSINAKAQRREADQESKGSQKSKEEEPPKSSSSLSFRYQILLPVLSSFVLRKSW